MSVRDYRSFSFSSAVLRPACASTLDLMGYNVDAKAGLKIAEEKLKDL